MSEIKFFKLEGRVCTVHIDWFNNDILIQIASKARHKALSKDKISVRVAYEKCKGRISASKIEKIEDIYNVKFYEKDGITWVEFKV